ncbi:MAG: hypothetical protein IT479_16205 [Xanthomonadales bacterium]|nr:hypothetical protein [Xanthomonadales bacterium]MCC6594804.1 hypothetical protein [Xanthomonadales bacterium]MCE7929978.1 hypothetical protein [Xanthomonadales bacterium PRO6]
MSTRALAILLTAWAGLAAAVPPRPVGRPSIAGIVTDPALGELSGLAASQRARDRYWAINDGGNDNHLLLIDGRGRVLRSFALDGVANVDWEDLASFRWRGKAWLLVADTGDNSGARPHVSLWLVEEPMHDAASARATGARELRLRYPDAAHDVEAMTVDAEAGHVYLLSKRTVPPVLYRLRLEDVGDSGVVTVERVAGLDGIPQPTARDIARDGALSRFRSQTTAMALDCSRRGLLVLTYAAIYRFQRRSGQSWEQALPGQTPARSALSLLPQAEAMAFDTECRTLHVGSEKAPVPLLRFRYRALPPDVIGPDAED